MRKFLDDLWRDLAGLPPEEEPKKLPPLAALKASEWSTPFEKAMRNRLIMGSFRYGLLRDPKKKNWDRIGRIERECGLYKQDGNDERLVDIANMCLLEFEEGKHPNKHFIAADDKGHNRRVV
jgi:hypothetical protein